MVLSSDPSIAPAGPSCTPLDTETEVWGDERHVDGRTLRNILEILANKTHNLSTKTLPEGGEFCSRMFPGEARLIVYSTSTLTGREMLK
ncbi:hypothetical protein KOW79_019730 [Hemibagrus wyckioides]|uniref:Uncharacterized protein n=1 Tax=Hemibagrus wyckioides TaxID=337641 RepID=A0A9D3NAN2_9TELE|nr:hypothetical protein KOW79_019730 [Hemibagrus wyckioides]